MGFKISKVPFWQFAAYSDPRLDSFHPVSFKEVASRITRTLEAVKYVTELSICTLATAIQPPDVV